MDMIRSNGLVEVTVPVGQKIAISAENCTAVIYYSTSPASPARFYEQTRITDSAVELGTFTKDQIVKIEAIGAGKVVYQVATTPVIVTRYDDRLGVGVVPPTEAGGANFSGNIAVGGTVDGVDIAALEVDVDGFPDELKNLTTAEIQQLENIGAVTISSSQWGYVGVLDQSLTTSQNVQFATIGLGVAPTGTAVIHGQTGSTTDAVLRITDAGVANYNITFPDHTGFTWSTNTSSDKTFKLNNAGSGVFHFDLVDGFLYIAGTQVVSTRKTGWGAPSGTATRTTFDTTTVTLSELAERVHALIDDLTSHGLIGT